MSEVNEKNELENKLIEATENLDIKSGMYFFKIFYQESKGIIQWPIN